MTMKSTTNKRTTDLIGTAGLVAAVAVSAVMLIATPQTVQAHPAYAEKTGNVCGVCHVNVKGGGKLTDYGSKWFTGGMKAPAATNLPKKSKK